jgi:hypothetical protein
VRSISPPEAAEGQLVKDLLKDFQPRISGFRVTGHR